MADTFQRAKNLLQAVDTVIEAAAAPKGSQEGVRATSELSLATAKPGSSSSSSSNTSSQAAVKEYRRVFGCKPLKGKGPSKGKGKARVAKVKQWRKDCICLRDCEQTWKPSSEEKIELARMGLGLKSNVTFNNEGDGQYIHNVIMKEFPVLASCGGYTLLRLAENSHSMVEIEGPDNGMTVQYLKDILNQAKLYIRPLQKDITNEDMKPYSTPEVSS